MNGLYIGLMSGTSMDGIDAALVQIDQQSIKLLTSLLYPWPETLRQSLAEISQQQQCTLHALATLDSRCGETFAAASLALLENTRFTPQEIVAIGSHGQTLRHNPEAITPYSVQIGDPNRIAELTGITTVADFRRRDIAAGGQGAPLVPAFHRAVFASLQQRVILNIGGIANLTILHGETVTGFDTGPGNCLLDLWIQQQQRRRYDHNGDWASNGQINRALLEQLLGDHYFSLAPPKSTGTEYFSPSWLKRQLHDWQQLPAVDIQATLLALTVASIAAAIDRYSPETTEIVVCGGGVHNAALMRGLQDFLGQKTVCNSATLGLDPDWIEAMAFAWLAQQTLTGQAGNLAAVTGAQHPVILGGIYAAAL